LGDSSSLLQSDKSADSASLLGSPNFDETGGVSVSDSVKTSDDFDDSDLFSHSSEASETESPLPLSDIKASLTQQLSRALKFSLVAQNSAVFAPSRGFGQISDVSDSAAANPSDGFSGTDSLSTAEFPADSRSFGRSVRLQRSDELSESTKAVETVALEKTQEFLSAGGKASPSLVSSASFAASDHFGRSDESAASSDFGSSASASPPDSRPPSATASATATAAFGASSVSEASYVFPQSGFRWHSLPFAVSKQIGETSGAARTDGPRQSVSILSDEFQSSESIYASNKIAISVQPEQSSSLSNSISNFFFIPADYHLRVSHSVSLLS
jgi:hypothetical protein